MKKLMLLGLAVSLFSTASLEAKTIQRAKKQSPSTSFELNVAHINDHHSHLEEEKMPLKLNGKTVTVHIGGLPRVAQAIKNFRQGNKNIKKRIFTFIKNKKMLYFFWSDIEREVCSTSREIGRASCRERV